MPIYFYPCVFFGLFSFAAYLASRVYHRRAMRWVRWSERPMSPYCRKLYRLRIERAVKTSDDLIWISIRMCLVCVFFALLNGIHRILIHVNKESL